MPAELDGCWDRHAGAVEAYWARVRAAKRIGDVAPHVYPWTQVPVFADLMLFLILHGGKRATAHLLLEHEISGSPERAVGDYGVMLDGFGRPGCFIRTTKVKIEPFRAVDAAFAEAESEGGGSVLYWKQGHWAYFSGYREAHGREMSEDIPMVFEHFELIDPG